MVMFNPIAVVSEPQYAEMMQDMQQYYMNISWEFVNNWEYFVGNNSYDWKNGVPKSKLYVRLSESCTAQRREFIINGLRPYLDDSFSIVVDT